MALTVNITRFAQVTRPVEVELPVEAEEGGTESTKKVIQQEHVGWDIAVTVEGRWGGTSSTFFIDDLPDTAKEKDFVAWVKKKYGEKK